MNNKESNNLPSMTFNRDGKVNNPLFVTQVNGRFIVGGFIKEDLASMIF